MNQNLAERLQRACHAILPPDTIPLNAVRFLHWAPGNESMWAGLEQCLAKYMAASLCGRVREPLMFFGLHSNIELFPAGYKKLFTLGAGYMPYDASTEAILDEWKRTGEYIYKPLPEELKKPYLDSLKRLIKAIKHTFKYYPASLLEQKKGFMKKNPRAGMFEPRPLYDATQLADLDRLWQYNAFLSQIKGNNSEEESLQETFRKFEVSWNELNRQKQSAKGKRNFNELIMALDKALESHDHFISYIKKIEEGFHE